MKKESYLAPQISLIVIETENCVTAGSVQSLFINPNVQNELWVEDEDINLDFEWNN